MMKHTWKPVRVPGIFTRDVGGESLLYTSEEQSVHILNPTARFIWDRCDGKHTVNDIEQALRTSFAVPDDRNIISDIEHALDSFARKGLLESVSFR